MRLLTIDETKKMLNVDKRTLHLWDKKGTFKALRTKGGHRRYKEEDVKAMMGQETGCKKTVSLRVSSEKELIDDVFSLLVSFSGKTHNNKR